MGRVVSMNKENLYQLCLNFIEQRIQTAETALKQAREASNDDTKSSAGDKYETGRAMMQMEIDNNEMQLNKALQQQLELSKITLNQNSKKVEPGCVVITNHENYFISIAMGKMEIEGQVFYAISMASPVGTLLRNKVAGDQVDFQNRTIIIQQIV